ncbi:hypothetical protein DKX38_000374 [Salix brachista]|uniref:Uncharacterized protein n=1 Tax=Salix brachista TaxID=2182728 RepID=A0A5N5P0D0_9ROSI|nr:hypothetical protein DKX38_000374 [Salix brachista]
MTFFHPTSSDMWRKKPRNSASPILPLDSSTLLAAEEHENSINWAITVTKKKWVDPLLICLLKARLYCLIVGFIRLVRVWLHCLTWMRLTLPLLTYFSLHSPSLANSPCVAIVYMYIDFPFQEAIFCFSLLVS